MALTKAMFGYDIFTAASSAKCAVGAGGNKTLNGLVYLAGKPVTKTVIWSIAGPASLRNGVRRL